VDYGFTTKYARALQRERISYQTFIENENKNGEKVIYNIHGKYEHECYITIYILSFYKILKLQFILR
jgi:hypothetical protein